MTLSTGTLNLKFMQRAAVKVSSNQTTTTATAKLTPVITSASTTSNPLPLGEDSTKWTLPSRSNSSRSVDAEAVRFESSYLPFLGRGEADDVIVRARSGGGRMAFGGFGELEEDDESGDDADAGQREGDREEAGIRRKGKTKGIDKEGDHKVCMRMLLNG